MSNPSTIRSIYADSGVAQFNGTRTDMVLTLWHGHMREVPLRDPATFRRMAFNQQRFGIPGIGTSFNLGNQDDGYRGDREMTIGMLQARIDTLAGSAATSCATCAAMAARPALRALGRDEPFASVPGEVLPRGGRAR